VSIDRTLTNRFIRCTVKDDVSTFVVYFNEIDLSFPIEILFQYLLRLDNLTGNEHRFLLLE
jgi:hypothetical protein